VPGSPLPVEGKGRCTAGQALGVSRAVSPPVDAAAAAVALGWTTRRFVVHLLVALESGPTERDLEA
jgi:hypothetical protein